jgi:hypothetical protein
MGKDGMQAIAGCLDHMAALLCNNVPHEAIVMGEGSLHGLRMLLPKPGAALNVGEEEGHRAKGKVRSHG